MNGVIKIPLPTNEPVMVFAPGSPEKASLKGELQRMLSEEIEIPLIIGGKEVRTGNFADCRCPHDHNHLLGRYHKAGPDEIMLAVEEAKKAWKDFNRGLKV